MVKSDEYTEANLLKAKQILANNRTYNDETELLYRIQRFELYQFAKKWIKKYNEIHKQ